MALGYCLTCLKLCPIKQGEYKHAGGRERYWYPLEYLGEDGKRCPGEKRGI